MKKILLAVILATVSTMGFAQPRAIGIRTGVSGLEASYEHNMKRNQFLEGNFGIDFGYAANGTPGVKATAIYNFVWARPAWTNKGSWALYAGPGLSMGYVNDSIHYKVEKEIVHYNDEGFMIGACVQVGLEYTFWFPLQLSVDLRPTIGGHFADRAGFYDNGLLGFSPNISAKYRF